MKLETRLVMFAGIWYSLLAISHAVLRNTEMLGSFLLLFVCLFVCFLRKKTKLIAEIAFLQAHLVGS